MELEIKIGIVYCGRYAPKKRRVRDIIGNCIVYDVPGVLSFTPFECNADDFEDWKIGVYLAIDPTAMHNNGKKIK